MDRCTGSGKVEGSSQIPVLDVLIYLTGQCKKGRCCWGFSTRSRKFFTKGIQGTPVKKCKINRAQEREALSKAKEASKTLHCH